MVTVADTPNDAAFEARAQLSPPRLLGSRDPQSGEVYFPPRWYSVDGQLRECVPVELSESGTLSSHTVLGDVHYGEVDLADGPRIITKLAGADHEIGQIYRVNVMQADDGKLSWRFERA